MTVKKKKRQVQLFGYQKEGIRSIDSGLKYQGRALLADEMGTGKSVQAFGWGHWKLPEGKSTVIVCPATLKPHWQRECKNHFGRMSVILEGRKPDRSALQVSWPRPVFIINYDILHSRPMDRSWAEAMQQELDIGLVIADEVHQCKSPTTLRTKALKHLIQGVPHLIGLSGTPLVNQPPELWPFLNMLDPDEFPSYTRFAARYSVVDYTPWGPKYKGARNLRELHTRLKKDYMVRRLKKDVLTELPPKTRTLVPVAVNKKEWQEYMKAELDFVNWLKRTKPERADTARRAERLVKFNYLKQLVGQLKRPYVEQFLADLLYHRKVIVFTSYRETCQLLHQRFKGSTKVDGSVTGRHRQEAIDRFTNDPKCRLFVGNLKAAGVGWNGTVTDTVVFAELGWTPGEHTQAEDRPHRIGQRNTVNVFYLFIPNTVESRLLSIIQEKQKSLDGALDGLGDKDGDFRILDQLEKMMTTNRGQ